ncbi:MAG: efflux RND transporter permease subunit, partial [Bacillota bacterium]
MIKDVSIYEAKLYKDRIENIDGVDRVTWADSVEEIYQSNLFLQYDNIDDYYKDRNAVMDIAFVGNDSDKRTSQALEKIEDMLGDKGYYGGAAVQDRFLNEVLPKEMVLIMAFAVIIILGILTLTTNSWFEPVVFLVVILISIVINMGSNLIFGSISSMTLSVAGVLQLAIAMDYTIILLDNFTKERKHDLSVEEALSNAIRKSMTPILSAGAAAIIGFLAMILMRYTIGMDMGLVLAKGIAISLVTVVFLTPAFILRWYKIIEKMEHKPFVPSFLPLAKLIYRHRYVFLMITLLIALPSYIAKDMTAFTFGNDAMGLSKGTVVYEDDRAMNAEFGRNNLILIMVPNTSMVSEKLLSDELEDLNYVKYVTSLAGVLPEGVPESFLPDHLKSDLHTKNYARLILSIRTASESKLAFQSVDEIKGVVKKYYPDDSYVVGVTPSTQDIKAVLLDDWHKIDKVSLLGVALAIMIAFRSLSLPVLLMIPIQMATFANMAMPYILGKEIMYMGYIIVSCLQLGATIDYSIIMTNHYLEHRKENDKVTASILATADSTLPIVTSGMILAVAGFGVCFLSSVTAISELGELIGRGALFSIVMTVAVLPNLFVWADRFIILKNGELT